MSINNALGLQPLLRTKLYPPSLPDDCVSRGRLLSLLDRAMHVPLSVISAPAGYGKSVLASEWVSQLECKSVWLSLDNEDSDIRQFLAYLIAGAAEAVSETLESLQETLLESSQSAPVPIISAILGNALDALDEPIVIVLDDLHRLDNDSPVMELLLRLLDHPPPKLHLLILSRRGLPLSLGRLRANKQLAEIRLADLRFSATETAALMGAAANTALTESALQHLQEEIEGWPVGLRLVALMIKQSGNPDEAVARLHGGIPQAQEYMLQEVLTGLSPELKDCLLKASILDRFSADLLDVVCFPDRPDAGQGFAGAAFIRELERFNLFACSLDAQGEWFRFHHWFQLMLAYQLRQASVTENIRGMHLRAAHWFANNSETSEALKHYLAAGEPDQAADLVVQNFHAVLESNRWFVIDSWLAMLPESIRSGRVDVQLAQAWVSFCRLDVAQVAASLVRAELLLEDQDPHAGFADQFDFLRGWIIFWEGDLEGAQHLLGQAIDGFPVSPGMIAGELRTYLSLAQGMTGKYAEALQFLATERAAAGSAAGFPYLLRVISGQAHLHYLSGDLDAATAAIGRVRLIHGFNRSGYAVAWADYLNGLQDFSRGDFASALSHFAAAEKHINLLERRVAVDLLAGACMALELSGRRQAVSEAWLKLDQFVGNYALAECGWIVEAISARVALPGDPSLAALRWAQSVVVPKVTGAELMFWLINPSLTRARVLVMAGDLSDIENGLAQLDELLQQCHLFHNYCQQINIQPLRAVALSRLGKARMGKDDEALVVLAEAIRLAAPGNWRQPFIELGEAGAQLLKRLDVANEHVAFVQDVLQVIGAAKAVANAAVITKAGTPFNGSSAVSNGVEDNEALTNRELDILEFIEQRLQNKEIAERLHISPHTVGYHLKHIYQKLGVNGRRQAVQKAQSIGMLSGS